MEMGYDYDEQNEKHQHHEAVDGLFNLFNKANNDLAMLHDRLDKEFKQIYPDNANPMKLVARIKKIPASDVCNWLELQSTDLFFQFFWDGDIVQPA